MMKKRSKNNCDAATRRHGDAVKLSGLFQTRMLSVVLVSSFILLNIGCQPNQTILKSSESAPTPLSTVETKKTTVEQDLQDMRSADFTTILVLRRKDGGVFDSEDRKFLRENMPVETNRRIFSDEEKALIIGAEFRFPPENMQALSKRFNVENYSKPETKVETNSETNKAKPQANK